MLPVTRVKPIKDFKSLKGFSFPAKKTLVIKAPAVSRKSLRTPKVHKGKQSCCPTCNPSGWRRARAMEAKARSRD